MCANLKLHKLRQLINEALSYIGPFAHDARHSAVHGSKQCTFHDSKQSAVHGPWQSVAFYLRTTSKHTLAITVLA